MEKNGERLKKIRDIVLKVAEKYGVEVEKIILFGSRARGDYSEGSDCDILVVTKREHDRNKKYEFVHEAHRKIVWEIDIPVDIIVVSKRHQEEFKDVFGSIAGIATMEGRVI